MKILFDHPDPFLLMHGGFQIQIEQTKAGLESIGVDVEYLRWWDDRQTGDIIHYFGRPPLDYIRFAQEKNIKVIIAPLLTGLGSRSKRLRLLQKWMIRGLKTILPEMLRVPFHWDSFQLADACIALTSWEAYLMSAIFETESRKIHVLPNAVEPVFLEKVDAARQQWLVCTATVTPRKRVLELSRAAVQARTPVWIIGKPYSESDKYAEDFFSFARKHPEFIRYEGPVQDRTRLAKIYRQARGFVLLSTMETRSLSAEEAAACGCPLLLSDLPWAKSVFHDKAAYCPISSVQKTAEFLRRFYEQAPKLPPPPKPKTWAEVGQQLKDIYEIILRTA